MAHARDAIQLYLLRHAHAGAPEGWARSDDDRPLSIKGEQQSERLGRFLASVSFRPDAILTSPKVRAARTAQIVAAAIGASVAVDERLGRGLDLVTSTPADEPGGDTSTVDDRMGKRLDVLRSELLVDIAARPDELEVVDWLGGER